MSFFEQILKKMATDKFESIKGECSLLTYCMDEPWFLLMMKGLSSTSS